LSKTPKDAFEDENEYENEAPYKIVSLLQNGG